MMMLLLWAPLATLRLCPSLPPLPFSLLGRHYTHSLNLSLERLLSLKLLKSALPAQFLLVL